MKLNFVSVLQLIFITLKLMGYIDWSWFLVLMPFLLSSLLILTPVIIFVFLFFAVKLKEIKRLFQKR